MTGNAIAGKDVKLQYLNFAVIFDLLENSGIACLIKQFPLRSDFIAGLAAAFNILKWIMIAVALLLVLVSMAVFFIRLFLRREPIIDQ